MSAPPYTTALGLSASITRAGIWREVLEFVRLPLPLLRVRRGRFFDCNIWPDPCVFRVQRQPFLKPGFAISLDGIDGAFRFANATVDAFVRMDDEHILALVEAVHGAYLDAVHGFAANAAIVDDVGQLGVLPADCRGQLMCAIVVLARWLKMDAEETCVLWLDRDAEQLTFGGRGARDCWVAAPLSTEVRAILANPEAPMRPTRSYRGQHLMQGLVHRSSLF